MQALGAVARSPQAVFTLSPVAWAVAAAVCLTAVGAAPTHAQTRAPSAAPAQSFSVAAGPLAPALQAVASAANVLLTFTAEQTQGKTTRGIQGRYTPAHALDALLAGSGLQAVRLDNGGYVLRAAEVAQTATKTGASSATTATLPAVTVKAQTASDGLTEGTRLLTTPGPATAATGMGLTLRETPQSVTVITRERMDEQNLKTVLDVLSQAPGVQVDTSGDPVGSRSYLYSRGYEVTSYQLDGVTVPLDMLLEASDSGLASLGTAAYDSVTVVRGATGLLTGAGDPSGSISITRKRPTQTFQGTAELSLGAWNQRGVMVDVGGPLNAAGTLRGRLVGGHNAGNSWVDRYSAKSSLLYGIVEADLTPDTLLSLSLEHTQTRGKGGGWGSGGGGYPLLWSDGVTPFPAQRLGASLTPTWARNDDNRTTMSATLKHRFNADWNATLTYGRSQSNVNGRGGYADPLPVDAVPKQDFDLIVNESNTKVQFADAKLEGKYSLWGRKHDVVGGINISQVRFRQPFGYYGQEAVDISWNNEQFVYNTPDWAGLPNNSSQVYNKDESGVYLATRVRPTDALSVIVGGRVSSRKRFQAGLDPYAVRDDKRYNDVFIPYVGAVYDITPSLSAYASHTRVFQIPWMTTRDVNGRLLDPETGSNTELGLKGAWFNGRLNASVAVFQSGKDNLAVEDGNRLTPTGDQAYRAEDNTKGRGFEVEVAGQLSREWQIQGGFTQFRIRDSQGAVLGTMQAARQLKLYTSYRPAALPQLTVGGGVVWRSKTYSYDAEWNTPEQNAAYVIPSYAVYNLNVGYDLTPALRLSVNLNNVLNKRYRTNVYSQIYGAPRNLYASLKYKF